MEVDGGRPEEQHIAIENRGQLILPIAALRFIRFPVVEP
jgi:hypothetical protein